MDLELVTPPTGPVLQFADVSDWLRADTEQQYLIEDLIREASAQAEYWTGRALLTQVWKCHFHDSFPYDSRKLNPEEIPIPKPKLQSIDAIEYVDPDGGDQTLVEGTDFEVNVNSSPGTIRPMADKYWPTCDDIYNAATITFTCGHGDDTAALLADPVANGILETMKLYMADRLENPQTMALVPVGSGGIHLPAVAPHIRALFLQHTVWTV